MTSVNFIICEYIYRNWVLESTSQRGFALDHNIEESIVRKIKNTVLKKKDYEYSIPVTTLQKICEARGLKLSDFFKLIEH
ncbi:MAG: transcriptional regulator [Flavobacteriaceae bacterium CG17_big_fil_post_rev_8_21_14_2_50_33_15]|nr:MAG: transcriptional regulator [Flavobacteriaceae bacterium CG17_big_fil_post_rev_8_21_14_2_50_33_15]PJB20155.1 MAG: transcriptional regulator [Flavobacteriaceae bacterium CG_4_9_14_3_um_filter_33_16]